MKTMLQNNFKIHKCTLRNLLFTLTIMLCFFTVGISQQSHVANLAITLVSINDSTPLPFAHVTCEYASGNKIKKASGITNYNGALTLQTQVPCILKAFKLGYKYLNTEIKTSGEHTVYLQPLHVQLKETEVSTAQHGNSTEQNSVYNIKVIDARQIQQQSATTLNDLLQGQMKIRVAQDPILGSTLALQGLSGQNVKILIDGVPIIGRENGNIDLNQINLQQIERVEIVEGPLSSVYGADALGGVINLITKFKSDLPLEISVKSKYETVGNFNNDVALNLNKRTNSLFVNIGRNFFDGYNDLPETRSQIFNPKLQYIAAIGVGHTTGKTEIKLKTDYLDETVIDKSEATITPYEAYAFDNIYQTRRINNALFLNHIFKDKSTFNVQLSHNIYNRIKRDYRKNLVTLDNQELPVDINVNQSLFDATVFRAVHNYLAKKKYSVQSGIDFQFETGRGGRLRNNLQRIADYAAFVSVEYKPFTLLTVRPALRASYNTAYGYPVVPSINVKYVFKRNSTLRASVAKGFRAPSLKELDLSFIDVNHNIQGNQNLKPEQSVNYQLTFDHNLFYNTSMFHFEAQTFYNKVQNIITLGLIDVNELKYQYVNTGKFSNVGMGLTAGYNTNRINVEASFFNIAAYNIFSETYNLPTFISSPEYRASITYALPIHDFKVSYFVKYNGKSQAFALNANNSPYLTQMDAFTLMDIMLSKKIMKQRITLATGIKNIMDVNSVTNSLVDIVPHNANNQTPIAMGRNFVFEMRINLIGAKTNTPSK